MRMSKSIVLATGFALLWPLGVHAQQDQAPGQDHAASPSDIEGGTMFATSCGFCHPSGGRTAGQGAEARRHEA